MPVRFWSRYSESERRRQLLLLSNCSEEGCVWQTAARNLNSQPLEQQSTFAGDTGVCSTEDNWLTHSHVHKPRTQRIFLVYIFSLKFGEIQSYL